MNRRNASALVALPLCLLCVTASGLCAAAVPEVLNLSGRLAQDGQPLTGEVALTVTFYDDAEGSSPASILWADVVTTSLQEGRFHVLLGADPANPLPPALTEGAEVFVGLAVNEDAEMTPRMRIASVPFALSAGSCQLLGGKSASDFSTPGHGHPEVADLYAAIDHQHPPYTGTDFALSNQVCPPGQVVSGINDAGDLVCTPDADTLYTAGMGILQDGTALMLDASFVEVLAKGVCYDAADELWLDLDGRYAPLAHTHDQFYDKTQVDSLLTTKSDVGHAHPSPIPAGSVLFSTSHNDAGLLASGYKRLEGTLVAGARWAPLPTADAPSGRYDHTCTWNGTALYCWGGRASYYGVYGDGAAYLPSTNTWKAMSNSSAPAGRALHTAVLAGEGIAYWGGQYYDTSTKYRNSGAIYYPATDTWSAAMGTTGAPSARGQHTAVWTGTQMIVWGGYGGTYLQDGGRYTPATNSWSPLFQGLTARSDHTAVWTGTYMVVWGGGNGTVVFADGAVYDPKMDQWSPLPAVPASFAGRRQHTAVWTGDEMIIYGGNSTAGSTAALKSAAAFSFAKGTWRLIDTSSLIVGQMLHAAAWTGSRMIVWGGVDTTSQYSAAGSVYDLASDKWIGMEVQDAPAPRSLRQSAGAWVDTAFVVFGGLVSGAATNTGGRYELGLTLYPYQKQQDP
jgi:hypothetical protein